MDMTSFSSPYICGVMRCDGLTTGHLMSVGGCVFLLCRRGKAVFSVNSRRFILSSGYMGFIEFDMVTVPVEVSADFEAVYMSVDFEATQDIFFLVTSNRFWDFVYKRPMFPLPEDLLPAVGHWFDIVNWMYVNSSDSVKEKTLRNEAENFILNMAEQVEARLGKLGINPAKNRAWTIINDFIGLLGRHYAAHHDVAYYAACLNVTPNYLNIITRRNVGTTAKEQINLQIGLVAKMLLDTTDLTVKQIAERLHYDDPSYLCRIFRKQTGMSPIQYRNKVRNGKN